MSVFSVIKSYKLQKVDKRVANKDRVSMRDVSGVVNVGGFDFFPVNFKNSNLVTMFQDGPSARLNNLVGWPRGLIVTLKDARNKAVDGIIARHMRAMDPMAENIEVPDAINPRMRLFHEAKVPPIVSVDMHSFMTDSGNAVPGCQIKVCTHPKAHGLMSIEFNDFNMSWIASMCCRTYPDHAGVDEGSDDEQDRVDMVRSWLPSKVHLIANSKKKHGYFLRARNNAKQTLRAVTLEPGIPNVELKEFIDNEVMALLKREEEKDNKTHAADASMKGA